MSFLKLVSGFTKSFAENICLIKTDYDKTNFTEGVPLVFLFFVQFMDSSACSIFLIMFPEAAIRVLSFNVMP